MPKWIEWFIEPFTIPAYKITLYDGFRALVFMFICFVLFILLVRLILWIGETIEKIRRKKK